MGAPPKRQTRNTKISMPAVISPSQPPCELLTTSAPAQVLPPLLLKIPTPTSSDMDVGLLVECDEYVLDDDAQYPLVRSSFCRLNPPADDAWVYTAPRETSHSIRYHWTGFPLPGSASSALSTSSPTHEHPSIRPSDSSGASYDQCAYSTQNRWPRFSLPSSPPSTSSSNHEPAGSLSAGCRQCACGDATRPQNYSTSRTSGVGFSWRIDRTTFSDTLSGRRPRL